ncbi:cobyric acid synthase [Tessaracoccus massiliensis]|uniref:cobyric acid synthase n=1 Tax=Tessaracoccus massiliensis TaxID=1522311 RepID=UPI0005902655|nr:cobyric acid synthase [Tessaracoccus massiliensis]
MTGILIAGTSSDAGKSLVVTGLCRAARRRGIDVAPFKAQNMSNNSMVVEGGEIGRAQYLQAQAALVTPSTAMNPVLLKPGSERTSHVILRGQPAGELRSGQYTTDRAHLAQAAHAAYRELAETHELVICEGAGSPAEINLRRGDYTNMGLATAFDLPVVLVGDIDRGGVLASLYGTWALLDGADRALLAGYVINKFRGDAHILTPGLDEITRRTGMPSFGVLPWLDGVWLDGEDTLEVGRWRTRAAAPEASLRVAVIRFPRISNATDVDALASEPGVDVVVTTNPRVAHDADVLVLPGSRATVSDLAWLRDRGLADVVAERHRDGRTTVGICGGYQMLGGEIADGVEGESARGLSILGHRTDFRAEKTLSRPTGQWRGHPVTTGYEIHHGVASVGSTDEPFLDGTRRGNTWGTMWHGAFESDDFRRAWLAEAARAAGSTWQPRPDAPGFADAREAMIDTLAAAMEQHLNLDQLLALAMSPNPRRPQ